MSRPILFDGSVLAKGPITGVAGSFLATLGAYARSTDRRLVLLTPIAPEFRIPQIEGVEHEACIDGRRWRRMRRITLACRRHDAALLHSPITAVPRPHCPVVATAHDVPWLYEDLRDEPGARWSQRLALRRAARYADALIAPSAATAADIRRVVEADVEIIPHGIEMPEERGELGEHFLVLADGRIRKNHARVRAARQLARSERARFPRLNFVGPGQEQGYVEENRKWELLRDSRALVHFSLLEGFGLPVLEAMAHGVPVICSNDRSLLELTGGDAALHADATNVREMADAMLRIHEDEALRRTLIQRGRDRARQFPLTRSAEGWRDLHEQLLRP